MEIKSLRIGNLINGLYYEDNDEKTCICEVLAIDSTDNSEYPIWVESVANVEVFLSFEPIQLTEEVLLMCGAVKNSEKIIVNEYEYYEDFWINEFFSVLFIYSNYGNVQQFEIVYNSHGNNVYNVYGIKNTEYLHTLQNVLHLTGEELTYNHSPSI